MVELIVKKIADKRKDEDNDVIENPIEVGDDGRSPHTVEIIRFNYDGDGNAVCITTDDEGKHTVTTFGGSDLDTLLGMNDEVTEQFYELK